MNAELNKTILLTKFYHRGKWNIGFRFKYNEHYYKSIKGLEGALYTRTHKCLYLPYNKKAYESFLALGFEHRISPPEETSSTRHSLETSAIAAIPKAAPMNEGRKSESDIQAPRGVEKITWQGSCFFIQLNYQDDEVKFIKALKRSYWDPKQKLWVCKGILSNLKKLQNRYNYWDAPTYSKLEELTTTVTKQPRVIIKAVPADLSKVEVAIWNSTLATQLIKKVTERQYDADKKVWYIPRNKALVDRYVALCRANDCEVIEMLSWVMEQPLSKSRNGKKWLKRILQSVPPELLPLMKEYGNVFVREQYSYATMKVYCSTFQRYLMAQDDLAKVKDHNQADIEQYLNTIAQKPISANELNKHISAIKLFYKKVVGWSDMRLAVVNRPRLPKNLPYIFSKGEVQRLFDQVDNLKHRCLLLLTYGCGLRSGEVVALQLRDVMVDRGQIFVRGGKGKKDRVVMLPKSIVPILQAYMQKYRPDNWLFPGQNRNRPYSSSSLRMIFKRAISKAGLDKRHKLHNLRHSFATHLMESGTQQRLIQKLLGHKSSKTTEIYTQVSKYSIAQVDSPLDKLDLSVETVQKEE